MQRELKRVPLDFDYPLGKVWHGYNISHKFTLCLSEDDEYCQHCRKMAVLKGIPTTSYGCPNMEEYFSEVKTKLCELCEPPKGEGYQLWETVSEGSPMSPVFKTLDELCAWCEDNATVFAFEKTSREEWMQLLSERK